MLERSYSGVQAYCQSKLAQIMLALDLADELEGTGVTATALHPATYMPTKIVPTPASRLEEGVEATYRLAADPAHDGDRCLLQRLVAQRAHEQAYDAEARRRLAELSARLTGV